ncbi:helix-turn-helix transcriptional regulator [Pseudochryseolinea flava]|uniref:DNA-binding response regulator n=1 Tax=Pseudochryseolinea flava TaxID=2059302 RepID=A0A364Y4Y8_9BACT|nr:LuxR C-terminal-related transcriptional regulator [Pseudochryseolinea flava]RAW01883.1 DNA-binding response regulator [Pseudochryseolinea flava]
MRRTVVLYSLALAALVFILKFLEYRYFVRDLSMEFYLGLVAVMFTALGVWAGYKLTRKKPVVVEVPVRSFVLDEGLLAQLTISKREYEVLELIAKGLSNQEIANKLFVSLNTVKTHTSNLFSKLDVKRRTQAIEKAQSLRLLP